jgi:hypothetical protein
MRFFMRARLGALILLIVGSALLTACADHSGELLTGTWSASGMPSDGRAAMAPAGAEGAVGPIVLMLRDDHTCDLHMGLARFSGNWVYEAPRKELQLELALEPAEEPSADAAPEKVHWVAYLEPRKPSLEMFTVGARMMRETKQVVGSDMHGILLLKQ